MKAGPQLGQPFIDALRKYWPTMSANEISAITGYRTNSIYKWVKILGLQHDEATAARMRANKKKNFALSRTPESVAKISQSRLRLFRLERFRLMSGSPQKTKVHINLQPRRVQLAISNLCRHRNYYQTEPGYTLYYDSHTRRCNYHRYTEEYFTRVYGIQFVQGDEEEED